MANHDANAKSLELLPQPDLMSSLGVILSDESEGATRRQQ